MSPDTTLMASLEKLDSLEPALAQELKEAANLEQAMECIIASARRHDIALDAGQLGALLHTIKTNMEKGELNDEQLAGVAGGSFGALTRGIPKIFSNAAEDR